VLYKYHGKLESSSLRGLFYLGANNERIFHVGLGFTRPFPKSNKRTRFESFGLLPLTFSGAVITQLCEKEPEVHDFSKIGQYHRARRRILVSNDLDDVTRRQQMVSLKISETSKIPNMLRNRSQLLQDYQSLLRTISEALKLNL
jgi:hypothetical protein